MRSATRRVEGLQRLCHRARNIDLRVSGSSLTGSTSMIYFLLPVKTVAIVHIVRSRDTGPFVKGIRRQDHLQIGCSNCYFRIRQAALPKAHCYSPMIRFSVTTLFYYLSGMCSKSLRFSSRSQRISSLICCLVAGSSCADLRSAVCVRIAACSRRVRCMEVVRPSPQSEMSGSCETAPQSATSNRMDFDDEAKP